jgi:hypothetical protein
VPIIKLLDRVEPFKKAVKGVYLLAGAALRTCCISVNKLCIVLVIPAEEGGNTPFNKATLVMMIAYLFTLAAQDDSINAFKCGCSVIDDLTYAKRCAIGPGLVKDEASKQDPRCPLGTKCFGGYCTTAWSGVACVNPYQNPLTKALKLPSSTTSSEEEWLATRTTLCGRGALLHYVLLGWAAFFVMELVVRYVGHQGFLNFFTAKSKYKKKHPDDPVPKSFVPRTIVNAPNVLDAVCILATAGGIFLTEFTLEVQVLNANISLLQTQGDEGWSFLTPTGPRVLKFLRLFIVARVAFRLIPIVASVPIVAVILRGFRGVTTIMVAFCLLLIMVFFFTLFGRELFLYYGPDQGCNECLECEQVGVGRVCKDACSDVKFDGCAVFKSADSCNLNICKWIPPSTAALSAFDAKIKDAERAVFREEPGTPALEAAELALKTLEAAPPNGVCLFDKTKGGVCRANLANGHFQAVLTFDTLNEGLQLLLDIVIGANWYANTVEGVTEMGVPGMLFFILFFYVTNYQFLRLFVCIIAANYELEEDEKLEAQEIILMYEFDIAKETPTSDYYKEYQAEKLDINFDPVGAYDDFSFNKHYMKLLHGAKLSLKELLEAQSGNLSSLMPPMDDDEDPNNGKLYESDSEDEEEDTRIVYYETDEIADLLTINTIKLQKKKASAAGGGGSAFDEEEPSLVERARVHVARLLETTAFGMLILLTVMLSIAAILVALPPDIEAFSGVIFLAIFLIEMFLKWFAMGWFGKSGYFKDGYCQLDFLLVCLQIFDILENNFNFLFPPGHPNANIVKGFRALRAMRLVIKLAVLVPALSVIMVGLAASLPAVLSLIMCNCLILFVFSLIAIEQFSGLFDACNVSGKRPLLDRGLTLLDKIDCVGAEQRAPTQYAEQRMWYEGISRDIFAFPAPRTWATSGTLYQQLTFNNILDCYVSFFNLLLRSQIGSTTEALMAATNRDQAPVRMENPQNALFIVLFQILLGIFVAQVVVGIVMTNLKMKSGLAYHTQEQMAWPATKAALNFITHPLAGKRIPPLVESENAVVKLVETIQLKCFMLLENWKFQYLLTFTVVLSCATQATGHFGASRQWLMVTWWINVVCLLLFIFEAIVKIVFNYNRYFRNGSDVFDFTLTVLGVLELFVLPKYNMELGLGSLRQFRLIRIGDNFPVFVNMKQCIIMSFPEALAVVILLGVNIFIFGCVMQTLFPGVKYGSVFAPDSNAQDMINAMKLLFVMSSGAGGRDPKTSWGHSRFITSCLRSFAPLLHAAPLILYHRWGACVRFRGLWRATDWLVRG